MLVAAMLTAAFTRSTAVSAFVVAMLALVGLFCIPAAYNGSRAEQKRSILYAILCLSIMVISVLSAAI